MKSRRGMEIYLLGRTHIQARTVISFVHSEGPQYPIIPNLMSKITTSFDYSRNVHYFSQKYKDNYQPPDVA